MIRRRRRVRIHFLGAEHSLEGIQMGRRPVGGHYVLEAAKLKEAENRTIPLSGHVEVPKEHVFFIQVNP